MPLSDHEQQLLDQMEQALVTEDPRFASTFRGTLKNVNMKAKGSKNLGLAILGIIAGIAGLMLGVSTSTPFVGVIGFVVIVLSLASAFSQKSVSVSPSSSSSAKASKKSFMQNLENRWDKRQGN